MKELNLDKLDIAIINFFKSAYTGKSCLLDNDVYRFCGEIMLDIERENVNNHIKNCVNCATKIEILKSFMGEELDSEEEDYIM